MNNDSKPQVFYVNATNIAQSKYDFIMNLFQSLPKVTADSEEITGESENVCKIVMSPQHFKDFIAAAMDQLTKYEKQFGTINTEIISDSENEQN